MQYVAAFDPKNPVPPVAWARQREAEGWYCMPVSETAQLIAPLLF
jgi:hypothetical protein